MTIFDQLGLDYTFFVEMGIVVVVFLFLGNVFFRPYMKLFAARHKRTVDDREAARKLMEQAQSKLTEYKRRLDEANLSARKEYETAILEAKKVESTTLSQARDSAKKVVQEAADAANAQKENLKKAIEQEIPNLAKAVSERILAKGD